MTFTVDIDNTILRSDAIQCDKCGRYKYVNASPLRKRIDEVNKAYDEGHEIILWTGRGWDTKAMTEKQLSKLRIKYHDLIMGKPLGIYIDADSYKSIGEYYEQRNSI